MRGQGDLFDGVKPRAARRVLMHVHDAGYSDGYHADFTGPAVRLRCRGCGHDTGWVPMAPGDKRGRACPACNETKEDTNGHTH